MPKTPRVSIPMTDEQQHDLSGLLHDLQSPKVRGTPVAQSQRLKLPGFVAKLALERAAQLRAEAKARKK